MSEKVKDPKTQNKKITLAGLYKAYIPLFLVVVVLLAGQAYLDLKLPEYMAKIVRVLTDISGVNKINEILKAGGIMLGYSLGVTACSIAVGYIAAHIGAGLSRDLRAALFEKVTAFSATEMDKYTVSSLITRSTNDVSQIQNFTILAMRMAVYAPILAVVGTIKAVRASQGMNNLVWVIVGAVVIILISIIVIMAIVQPKFLKTQKLIDKVNSVARDGLNGMMVIRAFNTNKYEEKRFSEVNSDLTQTGLFANRVVSFIMPIISLVMNSISLVVILIAAFAANTTAQVSYMMEFIQYAVQVVTSFMMLAMIFAFMPRAMVSFKRVNAVLKEDITVYTKDGAIDAKRLKGEVVFENVAFSYPNAETNVLENISFKCSPGETTAIIGSTGSGKSTIINLLPRIYDVTAGAVKIDGVDVRDYTLESLRDNISFVTQKSTLFSGTIEDNIQYGKDLPDNLSTEKSIEIAQAEHFISKKEEGVNSHIAQAGANISGGQKQRLSIARAVYKNAPVMVFDDSFSALDFKTDAALRAALKDNLNDTNVIIVAQRIGSIMNADRIIVLDQGKAVGIGTHKELMESCDVYRDIAASQLSEKELSDNG